MTPLLRQLLEQGGSIPDPEHLGAVPPQLDKLSPVPLSAGQMLSHYEILGTLGAGAMGVVFRARDTRLEREVALKVLPGAMVADKEHLARFEREAKLLASLNHPNVATIYDVDHVDGVWFITLELVPGETLRDRLAKGPLLLTEAVHVARQIAAGLQAAHETEIVHRDLKPANIILRPDGHVKILDFGLAKRTDVGGDSAAVELTQQYQILGTPGYLSPEQARGEAADQRADIWAFGCILFECLAGQKAFRGETVGETIRATFEHIPDFETLPPKTPHALRVLVSRCLSKDSKDRLRDIADVRILLEGAVDRSISMVSGPIVITQPAKSTRALVASLVAAVLVAGTLAFFLIRGSSDVARAPAPTGMRTITLPFGTQLGWRATSANLSKLGKGSQTLAMSPDGRRVAYCVDDGIDSRIYIHTAGEFEGSPLRGTEKARNPFFSPEGDRIGFLDSEDSALKVVPVDGGGVPETICKISSPNFSACWTRDDAIIYSTLTGLWIVRPGREPKPEQLTAPRGGEIEHSDPAILPDLEHVLFTVSTGTESHIAIVSRKTKEWDLVVPNASSARFAKGWLLFAQEGAIRMVPFDPSSSDAIGVSQPLRDNVYTTPGSGGGRVITHYDVTSDGTLAYAPATARPTKSTAFWVDRDGKGKGEAICSGLGDWKHPRLSPNEDRFAIDILHESGVKDVYIWEFRRKLLTPFTDDGMNIMSAYTPSGSLTVRSTHRKKLLREFSNLGAEPFLLPPVKKGTVYADCWSSDGKILIMTVREEGDVFSLWHYTRGDKEPKLLLDKLSPRFGQLSPDGKWLAYVAKQRVFVTPYPEPTERFPISTEGGGEPLWSKDGKELFYRRPDGAMLVVTFDTEPKFDPHTPRVLFTNDYDVEPGGHQHYDISRDGKRFLMIKNEKLAPHWIHVVANALREAAPSR